METSLAKTLARKSRLSVAGVYRRDKTTIATERGTRAALQVTRAREGKPPLVATWGRTDLVRRTSAVLDDAPTRVWNRRTQLVERLLADTCERGGSREAVQVHHVRALKDLRQSGRGEQPAWARVMAARQRMTLVVCRACHHRIHAGHPIRGPDHRAGYRRAG